MARTRRKKQQQKTQRHVIVCAFVVETDEDEAIANDDPETGVIPHLVTQVDEALSELRVENENGTLFYEVKDVTMFTEMGFMHECAKHGHPRRFPDVWVDGPPAILTRNGN